VASEAASPAALAENLRGAGFMAVSMLGFSGNDAFMKSVAGDLALSQAVFIRSLLTTLFIAALAWWQGALRLPAGRRDRRLIAVRCFGEIGGTACFLTALFNMPIANASAILQSLPLAITLAAALLFEEPVGWRRYLAISIGFLGVLIIVRPGTEGFNAYALWALAAIGFIVTRDLATRRLSPDVPGTPVALVTSAVLTAAAALAAGLEDWQPLEARSLLALGTASLCLVVASLFSVTAMRVGDIGFVQPFRYSLLLWAMILGILMFGEWPDLWMLIGSGIVVATGLFTLYRERRLELAGPG
jgi:drug/metabolite transporter (DMT)-like permease